VIWVKRNQCIFETVTHANMKSLENNMETHKAYIKMFSMLLFNCQCDICILPKYVTTMTHQHQAWPMKLAVERTVALEVGLSGHSHVPIGRSHME
jgi:hypothetical protein